MKATAYFCARTAADGMISYFIVVVNDKNVVLGAFRYESFGLAADVFKRLYELKINAYEEYCQWYAIISEDKRKIIVKRYEDDTFVIKEANIIDKVEISY